MKNELIKLSKTLSELGYKEHSSVVNAMQAPTLVKLANNERLMLESRIADALRTNPTEDVLTGLRTRSNSIPFVFISPAFAHLFV